MGKRWEKRGMYEEGRRLLFDVEPGSPSFSLYLVSVKLLQSLSAAVIDGL